jgi:ATP-dependent RNA helicase RhlE
MYDKEREGRGVLEIGRGRVGGRKGGRKGGREGGREGEREGGREGNLPGRPLYTLEREG